MYPFYATGFYPPSNQQSQNFSKRKFLAEREESQRQTILTEKGISLKHQEQQRDLRKQKAAKDDPLKDRTEVKFFWMDLKGQFPQPVFFNIQRYRENSYNMGLKRQGQLRNLMIRHPDVKIDERSFINRPTVTKSPMASINSNDQNALSYFAAIIEDSVDTSIKTCDNIEEYMAFIGTPIPSPTELIQELEVIHSNGGQNSTRDAHVFERLTESDRVNTKSFCFSISQDDGTGINFDVWSNTPYACTSTINLDSNYIIYDGFTEVNNDDDFYKAFATSRLNSDNISKITRKELSLFHHSEIQHAIQLELDGIKEKQVLKPIAILGLLRQVKKILAAKGICVHTMKCIQELSL